MVFADRYELDVSLIFSALSNESAEELENLALFSRASDVIVRDAPDPFPGDIAQGKVRSRHGIRNEKDLAAAKIEIPSKVFIKEPIFEDLKRIFGKDVEILVNY